MAIQSNVLMQSGITVENAYCKISEIRLFKDQISFTLWSMKDSQSDSPIKSEGYYCGYSLDGENPFKQAYKYLKTLPEFAGATDV